MHQIAKKGFTKPTLYNKIRPTYPPPLFTFLSTLFKTPPQKAIDLAAGTGIFTRDLKKIIKHVVAVEPLGRMLDVLKRETPGVETVKCGVDGLGRLGVGVVDGVFVAQAFHWFSTEENLEIIRGVLKPGGNLVLVWNLEDGDEPWVREIRNCYEKKDRGIPQYRLGDWKNVFLKETTGFTDLKHKQFPFVMRNNREEIWLRVESKSYIQVLDKGERDILKKRIFEILDRYDYKFDGDGGIEYPYKCDLFYCQKI